MPDLQERLDELDELGLYRRMRLVSGPQGPRVVLDGKPVLLLCSNNYLGLADHPRVREAAADAAMRWGVGAGASRLVSGQHDGAPAPRGAAGRVQGHRERAAVRLGLPGEHRRRRRAGRAGRGRLLRRAQPRLDHRRLPARRAPRRSSTATATSSTSRGACARPSGRGALIVTDGVFSMDGDVAPLEEIVELARAPRRARGGRRGARHRRVGPGGRGAVAEAGLEGEVDVVVGTLGKALGSYGAFVALRRVMARYLVNTARSLIFSTAPAAARRSPRRSPRSSCCEEQPRRVEQLQANAALLRDELAREGFDVAGSRRRSSRWSSATPALAMRICEAALERGVFAQAIRPPTVPGGHVAAAPRGDGLAHARRAARGGARARPAALRSGFRPAASVPVAAAQRATPAAIFDGDAERPAAARGVSGRVAAPERGVRGLFVTGTDTGVGKTVRRRRDRRRAARARAARGRRVQAGRHRARRAGRAGLAARPRAARRRGRHARRRRSRRSASARRSRRTWRPSSRASTLDLDALVAAASAAAASAAPTCSSSRASAGCSSRSTRGRARVRDLAVALGLPRRRRRAARASARSTTRC